MSIKFVYFDTVGSIACIMDIFLDGINDEQ